MAAGILTLLTDFGTSDAYVAAMKGVILSRAPDLRIVDITHAVPPQDIRRAAFVLAEAAPWYPADTVHVVVVDPGVGTDRRAIAARFGLTRMEGNLCADEDGITPLQVDASGQRGRYIPYTDRPLNWHTDGYYNTAEKRLCAMTLHCVEPAAEGGENGLLDPDIAYILMRDENPAYIEALCHADAMAIPANEDAGGDVRAEVTGPVFSVLAGGQLYMRYTARKRNIRWRDDPVTGAAVAFLAGLLSGTSPYIIRHRLAAGEGLISNNVLHMRDGFADSADPAHRRLMLRGRFYDRVSGT